MKSRFFANISHEFRTPLTLIRGPLVDLDKQETETISMKRDVLGIMKRNTARLQNLINQLLDISRMETGTVKLQVSEGKLESFLRTIILSFLSLAESKKITYRYQLPGSDLYLWYDADKMEKILVNLISHAFKFTNEHGEITILGEYINQNETGDPEYFSLIITDTGKGIPSDRIDRIFDRFYKVNDSSESVAEGTGIGLALTKELVELYRGDIKVKSIEGKGTTFVLKVPVARDLFREDERIFLSEESPEPVAGEHYQPSEIIPALPVDKVEEKKKPVVLIVEDNPDLTRYIAGNLEKKYRIISAGEELQVRVKKLIEQRMLLREKFRQDFAGDTMDIKAPYDDLLLQKLMEMINKQPDNPEFNVDSMSEELNVSRTQLYRKVNAITGHAPKDLLRTIRLKKAVALFDRGERNISQVMYQIGFNNHSYFAKCFREQYKVNPSEYLKKKTR
jgi:AraC-like DNA-binding protein/anti-sigma regulatory factor (Ser/Thr protein kinase)